MLLEQLLAAGAYIAPGHIDFYDGARHLRLGVLDEHDEVTLTPEGEAFVAEMGGVEKKPLRAKKRAVKPEEPAAEAPAEPAVDVADAEMAGLIGELDGLV